MRCLAIFIENWTIIKSYGHSRAATHIPAPLGPEVHCQEMVLLCVQGYFGAGGYFKKHQQGQLISTAADGLRGGVLGSWNSCVWAVSQRRAMAESWSCIIFLLWCLFFCICISQCITWRHFCFILFDTAADGTVGRSVLLGVAQKGRGGLPAPGI